MKVHRIYVDTSAIGGCLDEQFADDSNRLLEAGKLGRVIILLSDMLIAELDEAPAAVQDVLKSIPESAVEFVPITNEIKRLRDAYIEAGVVRPKNIDDATHVAAATVAKADAIVSWNFRHIVRLEKMKGYNEVNQRLGYGVLTIITPRQVVYEDDDD